MSDQVPIYAVGKQGCFTHGIGGWEVVTVGLGVLKNRKTSGSAGNGTTILQTSTSQLNHYTDRATQALK